MTVDVVSKPAAEARLRHSEVQIEVGEANHGELRAHLKLRRLRLCENRQSAEEDEHRHSAPYAKDLLLHDLFFVSPYRNEVEERPERVRTPKIFVKSGCLPVS